MEFRFVFSCKDAKKFLMGVIACEVLFVLMYFFFMGSFSRFESFVNLFDLDGELNIPTWFSSMQLFLIGLIFVIMSRRTFQLSHLSPVFLLMVGLGFIFLSVDEVAAIHERITLLFRAGLEHISWIPRFRGNHGFWILPYSAFGLAFSLAVWRDLSAIFKKNRRVFFFLFAGVIVMFSGGVGLEIVGYQFDANTPFWLSKVEVALEEFLEMLGESLILYGAILLALDAANEK